MPKPPSPDEACSGIAIVCTAAGGFFGSVAKISLGDAAAASTTQRARLAKKDLKIMRRVVVSVARFHNRS